jgi:hypothetical protein
MRCPALHVMITIAAVLGLLTSASTALARGTPSAPTLDPERLAHLLGSDVAPASSLGVDADIHSPNMKLLGRSEKTGTLKRVRIRWLG